ncbi:MAG: hypothetical protein PHD19_11615 [Dechloromonas sp.]|nr:hypothetical protein [Dechloromonas sp.]
MSLTSLKWVAALAAAVALWWAWTTHNAHQQQIGYNRAAGEYAAQLAEAKAQALAAERGWNDKLKGAIDDRTTLEQALAAARARAAGADERLRRTADDFRNRLSAATAETARAAAAAAAELLGECGGRYRALAAAADGHAADLAQCDAAWPE